MRTACSCVVTAGQDIGVTGSGTAKDPYVISGSGGGSGGGASIPTGTIMGVRWGVGPGRVAAV